MMNIFVADNRCRIAEMLAMKGWLESRWRLTNVFAWSAFFLAINYGGRHEPATAMNVLLLMWLVLSCSVMTLAGSGVKSQSSIGFPEGLAESTQFTISLPVSRKLLVTVRACIGLVEAFTVTVIIACALWELFPSVSGSITTADFVRLVLTTLVWLPLPYCAALLSQAFLAEPWSFFPVGYGLTLVLWLLHKVSPAVDVIRAFGAASPLLTHRVPVSQLATAVLVAITLLLVVVWAVREHEY